MILGIAFYSYVIGNMTNLVANLDADQEEVNAKLSLLKEFKARTSLPMSMFSKIRRHLENNQKSQNSFHEQEKLLNDLPQQLRGHIIQCTHGELVERIDFFKRKESEFLFRVMPELKPLKLLQGDILYEQKDHADEIYMIRNGSVKLNVDITSFLLEDNNSIF